MKINVIILAYNVSILYVCTINLIINMIVSIKYTIKNTIYGHI